MGFPALRTRPVRPHDSWALLSRDLWDIEGRAWTGRDEVGAAVMAP